MFRGLEHLFCGGRLSQLRFFNLEKRKIWGNLASAFQYQEGAYRKGGDKLSSRTCCYRARGYAFKLKEGRFKLDLKKKYFTTGVVKHCTRLTRVVIDVPSQEMFKVRLDRTCNNTI